MGGCGRCRCGVVFPPLPSLNLGQRRDFSPMPLSGGEGLLHTSSAILEFILIAVAAFGLATVLANYVLIRPMEAREKARVEQVVQAQIAEAHRIKEDAHKDLESSKRQALLEAKEDALQLRTEVENENREKRAEIQRLERRLAQKEENLERRAEGLETKERQLQERDAELTSGKHELETLMNRQRQELQRVAGLSTEEARTLFLKTVEDDSRHEAAKLMRDIDDTARRNGERKARQIVTDRKSVV